MPKKYEAPELTLVGEAHEIVMGVGVSGSEMPHLSASDFEFEPDWPLI